MGLKGLTLYHLKSHLQKYRLGQQQARKQNALQQNTEFSGSSYNMHISSTSTKYSSSINNEQGETEIPIAEAVRCQIQVQKTLQEQIEVQKKLQMRVEAQGKYLQAILEKAQQRLCVDSQKPDFNLALSSFMQTINGENRNVIEEADVKPKLEGPSIDFDLNSRSSYDFIGINGSKPLHNR